jgi:hypothetical protein
MKTWRSGDIPSNIFNLSTMISLTFLPPLSLYLFDRRIRTGFIVFIVERV